MHRTSILPLVLLGSLASLLGCLPVAVSGASEPTEHTFKLTDADVAAAEDDACAQTWVTGDAAVDLATAHRLLAARGVKIAEGNPISTATALARKLRVVKGFSTHPEAEQASILSHELVHYCQRDSQGHTAFEESYLHSAGRWRTEVPAYSQSFRTMLVQCTPVAEVEHAIEARLTSMRTSYLLWDIDPEQYEAETRRIWRTGLALPTHCTP